MEMRNDGLSISRIVPLQLVQADESVQPVACRLVFSGADPYTVRAVFEGAGSTWLIGRELLAQGLLADLSCPAGYGDGKVGRDESPEYLLIALSGIEGDALLAAEAAAVADFIAETTALVPFGTEGLVMGGAIDEMITQLLQA